MRPASKVLVIVIIAAAVVGLSTVIDFYYRDNFATHFPAKTVSAPILRSGEIPYWNPFVGGGQPLAGNPNTLTFYPDSALYLVLPVRVAFTLHFLLHLTLAFFAMRGFLRALGLESAANAGAALYLLSGVVISSTAFYNLVAGVALVPLALAAFLRFLEQRSLTRALLLGSVLGLIVLAGESVTGIATGLTMLLLVDRRALSRQAIGGFVIALVTAAIIASPLLLAYSEIAPDVERAHHEYSTATVLATSVHPLRFVETFIGPIHGSITSSGTGGWFTTFEVRWPPLFLSIIISPLLIAALAASRKRDLRLVSAAAVFALLMLGSFNPIVRTLVEEFGSIGNARYPEKLAIHFTIFAIALVASWLTDLRPLTAGRFAVAAIAIALSGAAAVVAAPDRMRTVILIALGLTLAVIVAAKRGPSRSRAIVLLGIGVALPAIWAFAVMPVDLASRHDVNIEPAASGKRIWRLPVPAKLPQGSGSRAEYQVRAAMLEPAAGASAGLRYALDRSPEGMYSFLSRIVAERSAAVPLPLKIRYAQLLSCDLIASPEPLANDDLSLVEQREYRGSELFIYRLTGSLPYVHAPREIIAAGSVQEAVRLLESPTTSMKERIAGPRSNAMRASKPATVLAVRHVRSAIEVDVDAATESPLMLNESWFSGWKVTVDDEELPTFPANVDRLGTVVPAGRHVVRFEFGRRRVLTALALFFSIATLLIALGIFIRSSRSIAEPAR